MSIGFKKNGTSLDSIFQTRLGYQTDITNMNNYKLNGASIISRWQKWDGTIANQAALSGYKIKQAGVTYDFNQLFNKYGATYVNGSLDSSYLQGNQQFQGGPGITNTLTSTYGSGGSGSYTYNWTSYDFEVYPTDTYNTSTYFEWGDGFSYPTSFVYSTMFDCQIFDTVTGISVSTNMGTIDWFPGGGGPFCFVHDTLITLDDKTDIEIQHLKEGDSLLSYDIDGLPNTDDPTILNNWSSTSITGNSCTTTVISIKPAIVNTITNINNKYKTSKEHRHLIKRDNIWYFKQANTVVVGDILLDVNGNEEPVISVESEIKNYTVYKLDVENVDLFYANGILTHNIKQIQ